ncbi:MAG: glycosyltransferase [Candidatus Eremiobacterota bacterium]
MKEQDFTSQEGSSASVKLSIIIPTFNRRDVLFYCLKSLSNQSFPVDNFEVLVIDDGSTEDIPSLIKEFNQSLFIRYFRQDKKGQASAENLGIKHAAGEILLFLDNDMISTPGLVEEHFNFHQKYKNYIIRGSYANTSDYINPESASEGRFYSSAFFINGNVSMTKEILFKAGMFDEQFSSYGWLDLELGVRLKKIGAKAITNEKAFTYHYQKNFVIEDLAAIYKKEVERGHMGVLFYLKHPCLKVKLATMNPLVIFIGSLLYKCDWLNPLKGGKILYFLYNHKMNWLFKQVVNLVAMSWYSFGVREALVRVKRGNII